MKKKLEIITLILLVVTIPIASYVSAKDTVPRIFKIGAIQENPDQGNRQFGPMANYIANKLKEFNVQGGKVVVEKDLNGMLTV